MIRVALVFALMVGVLVGGLAAAMYAVEDIKVWDRSMYPGALVCPSGTSPYAAYVGAPMSMGSLNIECFDPNDAQDPIGKR